MGKDCWPVADCWLFYVKLSTVSDIIERGTGHAIVSRNSFTVYNNNRLLYVQKVKTHTITRGNQRPCCGYIPDWPFFFKYFFTYRKNPFSRAGASETRRISISSDACLPIIISRCTFEHNMSRCAYT